VIPTDSLNAFASGRNPKHAAVAATEGILRTLNRDELMGVMAHELGPGNNRSIRLGTIAAAFAGAISMIGNMAQWAMIFGGGYGDRRDDNRGGGLGALLMIILAPLAALFLT